MKNEYAIMKVAASILVVAGHVIIFYSNTGGIIPMQTDQLLAVFLIAWYLSWNLTDLFGINSIIRYFLWYYMGYLFDGQKHRIDSVINRKKKITIAVSILSILIIVLYLQTGNNLWTGLAAAGAGIVLSYCAAASMKSFIFASKIYCLLERNCFGIYLAHPMIVYVCFYYFRGWMKNPCITSITVTLVALTVSTLITEALRKLRLKAVLGEAA